MNFFKLYIGDYQRDTAHLSIVEHGAYMLMLQHYYATEKPLPVGKALHRMLRAQDKTERDAIDAVASQFWRTTDQGLVNDRADKEITKAAAQADTNAGIARAREAARKAAREAHEASTNRATNDQPNHSQTPDTRHQKEEDRGLQPPPSSGVGDVPPLEPVAPSAAGAVCLALRSAGLTATNPSHPELLALLAAGATAAELVAIVPSALGKRDPFAWLLIAAANRRKDAKATLAGMHHGAMPASPNRQEAQENRNRAAALEWAGKAKEAA